MKKLLLISYRFWPQGGIGTRRWSYFIRELLLHDIEIHVLTTDYQHHDTNVYLYKDTIDEINIHRVKSNIPPIFFREKITLIQRIIRKFNIIRNRLLGYIDIADSWEKHWIPKAYEIIEDNRIKNVIITGPPSSLHGHSIRLKARFPDINLMQDYRDLWNHDRTYNQLSQHKESIHSEALCLAMSDCVFSVSEQQRNILVKTYGLHDSKVKVLYNGFHAEVPRKNNISSPIIRIVYAGRLPKGRQKGLLLFLDCLKNKRVLSNEIEVHLYSNSSLDMGIKQSSYILLHHFVNPDELLTTLSQYDLGLTINDYRDNMYYGSKVYDYMACGMSIFCISEEGEVKDFIRKNDMPVSGYNVEEMSNAVDEILDRKFSMNVNRLIYQRFKIENITKNILEEMI